MSRRNSLLDFFIVLTVWKFPLSPSNRWSFSPVPQKVALHRVISSDAKWIQVFNKVYHFCVIFELFYLKHLHTYLQLLNCVYLRTHFFVRARVLTSFVHIVVGYYNWFTLLFFKNWLFYVFYYIPFLIQTCFFAFSSTGVSFRERFSVLRSKREKVCICLNVEKTTVRIGTANSGIAAMLLFTDKKPLPCPLHSVWLFSLLGDRSHTNSTPFYLFSCWYESQSKSCVIRIIYSETRSSFIIFPLYLFFL